MGDTSLVTSFRGRLRNLAKDPQRIPAALTRRIRPRSATRGFPWVHLPDGSVTFHEGGFVSASSPSALLARHNFEVEAIHRELANVRFNRSLEVGCGFGRLSMAFASHSDEHIAIDINEQALATARITYPRLTFHHAGALSLPFPDKHFDLVAAWTVLQHIRPENIETAAFEIRRVMTPGSTLLLCEETRDPEGSGGHTWHRSVHSYEQLFAPMALVHHENIDDIASIPGMESPGEIMLFQE